ncbi:MAG: hypothetical protein ABI207_05595 [Crocinitomicaceae bacterium]
MIKILTLFSFIISITTFAQEVNYEMKAVKYFINNIESDTIFKKECDCMYSDYDTNKTLSIYDSSYFEIKPRLALTTFKFDWSDSLIWTAFNTKTIHIQNNLELKRIKLTKDSKDFGTNHYLIRFSQRLEYKDWTIIEFNIKSEIRCSGINYYFLFNKAGEIEKYKMIIWCDSPG